MKKIFIIALAILSLAIDVKAEKGVLYFKSPANYEVLAVSPNGKWACGVYVDDSGITYGFRWDLTTGKTELMGGQCIPGGVSNNGVVASSFSSYIEGAGTIEVAGTWDGKWTMLELPNTKGCWAYGISADGQYVVGTDNSYISYVWKDGKLMQTLTSNGYNTAYTITPDGSLAAGWAYEHDGNRNAGYWTVADGQFHDLQPEVKGQPWMSAKRFTSDNKKLLFWGGYYVDEDNTDKGYGMRGLLDMETNKTTLIYPIGGMPYNFDLYDMSDDCSVVGMQQDNEGIEHAFFWKDGESMWLENYLVSRGADFNNQGIYDLGDDGHFLARGICISSDAKTYGIMYYDEDYLSTGNFYSMMVKLDEDLEHTVPVSVKAEQVTGLMTTAITWDEPLGDKTTLTGYDVYRNGEKTNTEPVSSRLYYDENLEAGTYEYSVVAVYSDGESAQSATSTVEVKAKIIEGPRNLVARQKGYDTAFASWQIPASNLAGLNYLSGATTDVEGFGGGDTSFESGIMIPAERMNLYNGYHLNAVSFYPLSEQDSWIINVYTRDETGTLINLGSFPVKQELTYGEENIVRLSRQITLQKDHDLIIGIQTNVKTSSYAVQGVFEGTLSVGRTDLIRQIGESDFYSLNEKSNGATYDMAWGTTAYIAPAETAANIDDVDHYEVSIDGFAPEEVKETRYENKSLADGEHNVRVNAIYTDGRYSDWQETTMTLAPDDEALKAITPNVRVDNKDVTASWSSPMDDDETVLGYCCDTKAAKSPNTTDDVTEFYARVDFPASTMRNYDGYEINKLSFVPLSNASFLLQVYADDKALTEIQPEDVNLGEWNTISIDPITIDRTKTYRFVIDCYDCPSGEAPLALDAYNQANDYSAYIQIEGESEWYTISDDTGLSGNWMMRMNVVDSDAEPFDISSYDVFVDGNKVADKLESQIFNTQIEADGSHTIRVDANYNTPAKVVTGKEVTFLTGEEAGISSINMRDYKIVGRYTTDGRQTKNSQKGVNIVKLSNGKVIKVINQK